MKPSLSVPLLLAFTLASVRGQVAAYHDQTAAQHQSQANTLGAQGCRMITLSIYDDPLNPRYAAVWVRRGGPSWVAFHGADSATYQTLYTTWAGQGYIPRILAATGSGASIRFAGVFEHDPTPHFASAPPSRVARIRDR